MYGFKLVLPVVQVLTTNPNPLRGMKYSAVIQVNRDDIDIWSHWSERSFKLPGQSRGCQRLAAVIFSPGRRRALDSELPRYSEVYDNVLAFIMDI